MGAIDLGNIWVISLKIDLFNLEIFLGHICKILHKRIEKPATGHAYFQFYGQKNHC